MHSLRRLIGIGSGVCSLGLALGVMGCGSDSVTQPSTSLAQTYWSLVLNEHAVTLAVTPPYDTIRLRPVAHNPAGDMLPPVGPVYYTVPDSVVTVDSTGLVTAHQETISRGRPAYVIASMQDTIHRVTLSDTVFIQVTATAPASPLTSLSIQPDPSDSAIRSVDYVNLTAPLATLTPMVLDANGVPMPDVLVAFSTSDSVVGYVTRRGASLITLPGGDLYGRVPGKVTFYATAWAYGVKKRDSLPYTMTIPRNMVISIESKTPVGSLTPILYFSPQTVVIGTGGVVTWDDGANFFTDSIDVKFDNPAAVDSAAPFNDPEPYFPYTGRGNIPAIYYDTTAINNGDYDSYYAKIRAARSFPVAGTYHYHSEIYGTTGTIIVK